MNNNAFFILNIWVLFFLTCIQNAGALTINLVSFKNGAGLERDIEIMTKELTQLGHDVQFVAYNGSLQRHADINVFMEMVNQAFFSYADKNYFIPNPEWFLCDHESLIKFDKVLCKTHESVRVCQKYTSNIEFISFTSLDQYDPLIKKNYKAPFHLGGRSELKNTQAIIKAWQLNPKFPMLTLLKTVHTKKIDEYPVLPNIYHNRFYLKKEEITNYQNQCGLHLCPSVTEGFGHYIMEAFSCAAAVITVDGPPMNEFVKDKRFLVPASGTTKIGMATGYLIDPQELAKVVDRILNLPDAELEKVGKGNREFYLQNERLFKKRLAEVFPPT